MNKSELREMIRERLRGTDRATLDRASTEIVRGIRGLPRWRDAQLVAAFLPLAREPQIQQLWQEESARVFCLPQVRDSDVVLLRIEDRDLLAGADWKLSSPAFSRCAEVAPEELDAILVPGVAFTRNGQRLGRGGGYYDRLLARCSSRTLRIGVCFESQIVPTLPAEAHDQHVDIVITEAAPA